MRKHFILLLNVFAYCALVGQPGQSSFVRYTTDQGLSNDYIKDVLKDHQGFLWVATMNGLNRFDSHGFRRFYYQEEQPDGLPDNYVKDLALAPDGSIWTSGNKGICRIDPVSLEFRRFFLPENRDTLENDRTGPIVFDKKGRAWVSSAYALHNFDPITGSIISYPIERRYAGYYHTYLDRQGKIWLTEAGAISYFDTLTHQFRSFPTTGPGFPATGISPLFTVEDHCDRLWVTTWFKGLMWYDPALDSLIDHPDGDPVSTAILPEIAPDGNPAFWVGGGHSGVYYYHPEKGTMSHFFSDPRDDHTHNNYIATAFYKDEGDGSVWIGTEAGLEHYAPISLRFNRVFMPINEEYGQFNLMSTAILDNNDPTGDTYYISMWGSGLFRWHRPTNTFEHFHRDNSGIRHNTLLCALQDQSGNLWLGTEGVTRYNPRTGQWKSWDCIPETIGLKANVLSTLEDCDGGLWFGTNGGGLFHYNRQTDRVEEYKLPAEAYLPGNRLRINNMNLDQQGRIWIANNHRPMRFDPETRELKLFRLKNIPDEYNQTSEILPMENGLLYASSHDCLLELDTNVNLLRKFDQTNGLRSNQVYFIESDPAGHIWFNTSHLLHCLDPVSGKFTYYGTADGLFKNTITDGLNRTADGKIFIGFQNAFNYFDPAGLQRNTLPPPVAITAIKVMDQERRPQVRHPLNLRALFFPKNQLEPETLLIIHPGEDIFSISFAALNFNQPRSNRYAYQLEGFNEDWVYTDLNSATYTNLDEGEYLFRVKAANNDGVWNDSGATLLIKVIPTVVKRWYFKAILIILIGLIIAGIWYYRSQQRLRLEVFRESLARDLHDEMGSTLSSIRFFSEFAKQQVPEGTPEVSTLLERISASASALSESMQDIIWAMKRRNDQLEDLSARMVEFGLRLLEARDIAFKTRIDAGFSGKSLSPEIRRNLYLIFKEAVNNAAKYAEASEVELTLSMKKGRLFMKIKDNGKGLDISFGHESRGGNGLHNMKKRAEEIGGNLEIYSDKMIGTWVEVEVKV